ncbi:hypothetical protein GUJ93_ZPchr0013g35562 [Zizania palustris]|uniref:Uncharacterized protein n=1 Tax=Zizania palustris TaxID=103762 RepID=A0A8J6C5F7_ZIZPA|nr:hypothetical protein GUJ93_ZPchr0013g35562 [Zizania palustris]
MGCRLRRESQATWRPGTAGPTQVTSSLRAHTQRRENHEPWRDGFTDMWPGIVEHRTAKQRAPVGVRAWVAGRMTRGGR